MLEQNDSHIIFLNPFCFGGIFDTASETPEQFVSLVQQLGSSQEQQMGPLPSKSCLQGSSLPSVVPIYCTAPATCARGSNVPLALREPRKLRDADRGCHWCGVALSVWGAMRLQLIAQTNKQNAGPWVCGDSGPGWRGDGAPGPVGCLQPIVEKKKKKKVSFLIPNQCNVKQRRRKEKPLGPPPRATSDVETSERLSVVSHTRPSELDGRGAGGQGGGDGYVTFDLQTAVSAFPPHHSCDASGPCMYYKNLIPDWQKIFFQWPLEHFGPKAFCL